METAVADPRGSPASPATSCREAGRAASTSTPPLAPAAIPPSPAGLLLSALALGCSLQLNFGQYHPLALLGLTLALLACAASILSPQHRVLRSLDAKLPQVLFLTLAVQFLLLLARSPGATGALAGAGANLWPFRAGILLAAACLTGALFAKGRSSRACLFAMLLTHAALGTWVLRAAPDPAVDVITFHRDACSAVTRGDNPYAITFPSPYPDASPFYAPGTVREGRLTFGFPYPPLSLLMALPGHLLGDFRYAQLAAMTGAGALIALARPTRLATAAAATLLFTPRGFFVLEAGWTEPFAVLLLAATTFAASRTRRARALPLALGMLVAVKQYLVLALLVAPLLRKGRGRRLGAGHVAPPPLSRYSGGGQGRGPLKFQISNLRFQRDGGKPPPQPSPGVPGEGAKSPEGLGFTATAAAVAASLTLPLALWDLPAFVRSAVVLQFRQPFRTDSLSYLAGVSHLTGWQAPAFIAFVIAALAALLCLRKCPRTPAGFAAAVGWVCFVFFAFNKQAFCNYYHFVIGALCCAAGATRPPEPETVA